MNDCKIKLVSKVYKNVLFKKNSRIWPLLRRGLIKFWHDPDCFLPIHEHMLYLPLSHALPQYLATLPLYDSLLMRLGTYLRQKDGYVFVIDVGANIGDTIAAFFDNNYPQDNYVGIEPNPHFRKYLFRNWGNQKQVKILPYLCTANQQSTQKYQIVEYNGTAEILRSDSGSLLDSKTLTQIIAEQPDFEKCNVIKIDTDGHDFDVIRGASEFIQQKHPAVFFECAPTSNANFIRDCIETLDYFANAGYKSFIAYDNIGHLIGKFSLSDLPIFTNIFTFQLTSRLFFIDILVMMEEDAILFGQNELEYHISIIADHQRRSALNWVLEQLKL